MRFCFAILCLALGFALTTWGEDLTTLTGKTYSNIEVQQVQWNSLLLKHDAGISKVFYAEIQADQREHYKQLKAAPVRKKVPAPQESKGPVGSNDLLTISGQLFKNVSVKRIEPDAILIYHEGGVAKIPFVEIPAEVQHKYETLTPANPDLPLGAHDIMTLNGKIYRNAHVRNIEPDGLTLHHDAGLTKVLFSVLPEEIQKKYEYDPQAARAYQKASLITQRNVARQQKAIRKENQAARRKQIQAEPIRVFEVRAVKVDTSKYRVRFSVRNYDDKPLEITAKIGFIGIKKFTIPANSSKSGLEVSTSFSKPTALTVSSVGYSTTKILHW